jgi:hypothetical protein
VKRALAVAAAISLAVAISCRIPDEHLHVRDAVGSDKPVDAGFDDADLGPCDHAAPWSPLVSVSGLATLRSVARLSPDELTAYFALGSDGTYATLPDTLFVSTRPNPDASFGSATVLTGVNGPDGQSTPTISVDGSTLVYVWGQPPLHTQGTDRDLFLSKRLGSNYEFGASSKLTFSMDAVEDDYPFIASNGDVWFASKRGGDNVVSIYKVTAVGGGQFGVVSEAGNLNSDTSANNFPLLTSDLHRVFFQRDGMILTATRFSVDDSFSSVTTVDELNHDPACASTNCRPASISPDGCRLYVGIGSAGSAVSMYIAAKPAT